MRWPWMRRAKLIELRPMVSKQGAGARRRVKEIQAEVFGARPGEVVWRSFKCPLG